MANLVNNGFKGPIVPINLDGGEILGVKCYKSLANTRARLTSASSWWRANT